MHDFINEFFLKTLIDNKLIIFAAVGQYLYMFLEYKLGQGDHGSVLGFLKYLVEKKNDKSS